MFSIYTLPQEDSLYWIFIEGVGGKIDARQAADEFHKASGDFCTRVIEGTSEIIIPRLPVAERKIT